MSVEYIYAYILISIATSGADHQIKLAIYHHQDLTKGFLMLIFVPNFIANREHINENKLSSSSSSSSSGPLLSSLCVGVSLWRANLHPNHKEAWQGNHGHGWCKFLAKGVCDLHRLIFLQNQTVQSFLLKC